MHRAGHVPAQGRTAAALERWEADSLVMQEGRPWICGVLTASSSLHCATLQLVPFPSELQRPVSTAGTVLCNACALIATPETSVYHTR